MACVWCLYTWCGVCVYGVYAYVVHVYGVYTMDVYVFVCGMVYVCIYVWCVCMVRGGEVGLSVSIRKYRRERRREREGQKSLVEDMNEQVTCS